MNWFYNRGYDKGLADGYEKGKDAAMQSVMYIMQENHILTKQNKEYKSENEDLKERVALLLTERIILLDRMTSIQHPEYQQQQAKEQAK